MTRFARAKGSKASNERAPADSTPWTVMKQQLEQAKKDGEEAKRRQEAEDQRVQNYQNFLNDRKTQKQASTWFDFPEDENSKKRKYDSGAKNKNKQSKDFKINHSENEDATSGMKRNHMDQSNDNEIQVKNLEASTNEQESNTLQDTSSAERNKKNKKKKNKFNKDSATATNLIDIAKNATHVNETHLNENTEVTENPSKKKNKKNKNRPLTEESAETSNYSESINQPQNKTVEANGNEENPPAGLNKSFPQKQGKKKTRGGKANRRKVIDDNSFHLIINGRDVQLVRFDGFPVMKKDAERLSELRKNMTSKGIPKSEVERTMKLERRRAEKALARLKRDVCYNCRKGGHNLSDCPDLKSKIPDDPNAVGGDGVCFKCGSTEHRQFECKVQRNQEFRFASCFICKEQGHIARQCPDNPKGLYPNGGGCKLCGDVTHLRKDCPTTKEQKEETSTRLETLGVGEDLEELQVNKQLENVTNVSAKKPKKIKF